MNGLIVRVRKYIVVEISRLPEARPPQYYQTILPLSKRVFLALYLDLLS
jgi:hypothetical protein